MTRVVNFREFGAHSCSYQHALKSEESRKKAKTWKAMKNPLPLGHGGDFTEEVKYSYFDLKNTVFSRNIADSKL